jgi:uncharacterized protein YbjQ (UPF0145 family)
MEAMMADKYYQVVFGGELVENLPKEKIKENLIQLLKKDATAIDRLLSSRFVIIKKNVDHETALRYTAALKRAGAICKISPQESEPEAEEPEVNQEVNQDVESISPLTACPQCGFDQQTSSRCKNCGAKIESIKKKETGTVKTTPVPSVGGKMILTNIEAVPGRTIVEHFGLVSGSTIRAKHIGRDLMAGLKNIVGGELKGYTELLQESRRQAVERMKEQAKQLGANAIINVRFSTSSVAQGAAELYAYGTAVRIE